MLAFNTLIIEPGNLCFNFHLVKLSIEQTDLGPDPTKGCMSEILLTTLMIFFL